MTRHRIPVRYVEVDALGVVFNAWYLVYFDEAMTAFLAARGLPYARIREMGIDFMLVRTEIDWTAPLRFGDTAEVEVSCAAVGRTSFTLSFTARRDDDEVATARTVYVVVGIDGGGKREVPGALRAALSG